MIAARIRPKGLAKAATGIAGYDQITRGGLPKGRTTLLLGGAGSGKTIFATQFLAHGVRYCKEPGIFVAFEESPDHIVGNLRDFNWGLDAMRANKKLFIFDARPGADLIQAGSFDLGGMLSALDAQVKKMSARRIVFDAVDVLLDLLPDHVSMRREVARLHEWLLSRGLTALITAKWLGDDPDKHDQRSLSFMQFMVDSAAVLNHRISLGVSQRNLRVMKYRGSDFDEHGHASRSSSASG